MAEAFDFRKNLYFHVKLCRSGRYVQANGARVYYEIYGEGEPLLLLHGGMSSIDTFRFQIPDLARHFQVILPERRGHGHSPDTGGPFSYKGMAEDMLAFMDALKIKSAKILGYSDGANLILHMALDQPSRVQRFVSVGGNFHHKGCVEEFQEELRQIPAGSTGEEGVDRNYEKYSPDGPGHYAEVFHKVKSLWLNEPTFRAEELRSIKCPALVLAGDRDVIYPEHTMEFYKALQNGYLGIVPDASHGLLKEYPELANRLILDFFQKSEEDLIKQNKPSPELQGEHDA